MTTDAETSATPIKDEKALYQEKIRYCCAIAQPMASRKLAKKIYKLVKKGWCWPFFCATKRVNHGFFSAAKEKTYCRNGLKDVQLRIRKGETGIVVFAGDVTPVDIMCHLPAVCEDHNIPYCFTPSRMDLGAAMGVKRGTLMVLIREHENYQAEFNELKEEIKHLSVVL